MPGLGKVYEADAGRRLWRPAAAPDGTPAPPSVQRQAHRQGSAEPRHHPARHRRGHGRTVGPPRHRQRSVDLIWHLPARYDDYSLMRTIDKLEPGEQVTVIANLWEVRERKISMNRTIVQGILGDSTGTLRATWYNKWVTKQLKPNTTMRFSGKIDLFRGQKTIENPVFEELDDERVATGRLSPVYPLTEGSVQQPGAQPDPRRARRLRALRQRPAAGPPAPHVRVGGPADGPATRSTFPTAPNSWPQRAAGWPLKSSSTSSWACCSAGARCRKSRRRPSTPRTTQLVAVHGRAALCPDRRAGARDRRNAARPRAQRSHDPRWCRAMWAAARRPSPPPACGWRRSTACSPPCWRPRRSWPNSTTVASAACWASSPAPTASRSTCSC